MKTCFKCNSELVREHPPDVFQCEECASRLAHGERMPRVVVQPHTDRRFVVLTITEQNVVSEGDSAPSKEPVQIIVDQALARMIGHALLSTG